jgi:hypothetical protein
MTLAEAKARGNETFIAQESLMIVTYDRQNIFIVQATDVCFCHRNSKSVKTLTKRFEKNLRPSQRLLSDNF